MHIMGFVINVSHAGLVSKLCEGWRSCHCLEWAHVSYAEPGFSPLREPRLQLTLTWWHTLSATSAAVQSSCSMFKSSPVLCTVHWELHGGRWEWVWGKATHKLFFYWSVRHIIFIAFSSVFFLLGLFASKSFNIWSLMTIFEIVLWWSPIIIV